LHGEERRFIKFIPKVLHFAMVRLKELEEDKSAAYSHLNLKDVYDLFDSAAQGTEAIKYAKIIVKVEEVRDQVNKGHWDLLKHQTDKLVLIKAFL
jgi:two-component SAPR family response regulator